MKVASLEDVVVQYFAVDDDLANNVPVKVASFPYLQTIIPDTDDVVQLNDIKWDVLRIEVDLDRGELNVYISQQFKY